MHLDCLLQVHKPKHEAISGKEPGIIVLANVEEVMQTKAHVCRLGMTQAIEEGASIVKRATGAFANSPSAGTHVNSVCAGNRQHVVLEGKPRIEQADIYPVEFSRAICRGIK